MPTPPHPNAPLGALQFLRLLYCTPFFMMIALIFVESVLAASVTYFVIQAAKDIANNAFRAIDFVWILLAQSMSYVLHGVSWIYGERAGFSAFARYMAIFSKDNRHQTGLLTDTAVREQVEPYLTNETFHLLFELMYELESGLQLFFGLLLSALVIGNEIDGAFPVAYGIIFICVMLLQFSVRKPVTRLYLANQRMTNRMTAQTYTAWDNIYSGNLYNYRLWSKRFKARVRDALRAQINAILLREGLSSISGIFGLIVIFATMAWVVAQDSGNLPMLVAIAATLPKQIDMTHEIHSLALGWNDLIALWTRATGVVNNMHPSAEEDPKERIQHDKLQLREGATSVACESLRDALAIALLHPTGRINVRGENGAGKSTLLLSLKAELKGQAYYWPTADRLAFAFSAKDEATRIEAHDADEEDGASSDADALTATNSTRKKGFSSGETQIRALQEIVAHTRAKVYLLDEWDANLDAANRARAWALIDQLAARARVIEISHRDVV